MPNMVVCRERMVSRRSKTSYPMSAHPSEHTNSKTQHRNAADTLMSAICILHLIIKIKKAASTIQNINWIQQHLFTSEHNTCLVKWREPAIQSQFETQLPVKVPKCWPHPHPSKLQSHPTRCAKSSPNWQESVIQPIMTYGKTRSAHNTFIWSPPTILACHKKRSKHSWKTTTEWTTKSQ